MKDGGEKVKVERMERGEVVDVERRREDGEGNKMGEYVGYKWGVGVWEYVKF